MGRTVSLTIDGHLVEVPEGTLIVNAAKQVGINIPVFCYHPKMEPVGMCRQCLVEVGRPVVNRDTGQIVLEEDKPKIQFGAKLETACTTPVSDGMVVLTASEKARAAQKEILEFLLTSHPLDCPVCDKGGECPLQNLTMAYGPSESRFLYDEKHHAEKHIPLGELIWLDRERCIQCARCVRFQDEIAGEAVLAFYQRGRSTDIITNSQPPFDSIFSGNTTDICPVGALTTADFRFGARPWEMQAVASVCGHCPVGCNITLNIRREVNSSGKLVIKRVMPRQNEAVNEIWICDKGRFAYHFAESDDRLRKPLVKKGGKLVGTNWDKAIKLTGEKLQSQKEKVIILASGRLSNEDLFNLKSLSDGLGGKALLYSYMGGGELTTAYGLTSGTNFGALAAETTILVAASDLYNEAPIWFVRVKQAAERGANLITASARETKLEKYSKYRIRYSYGDEVKTINSLMKKEKICESLTSAENLIVLYGSDGLGLAGSSALAAACANLLVETKHTGRLNNGLIGVWPHANDQGAWELRFKTEANLTKALKDKVVYIAAADPASDNPALAAALKEAKFIIVQELFLTETAKLADIVLPAQAYTERDGTFTSGERRVQRFYPAIPARWEAKCDYVITAEIAQEVGIKLESRSSSLVMSRIEASLKAFADISYSKLAEVYEQWPLIGRGDLFYGGTSYQNLQGLGVTLSLTPHVSLSGREVGGASNMELRPKENQWLAVPVRQLYDRGIMVSTSALLKKCISPTTVFLHPESLRRLGVEAGGQIEINGHKLEVRADAEVPTGVVLIPRSMGIPIQEPSIVVLKRA